MSTHDDDLDEQLEDEQTTESEHPGGVEDFDAFWSTRKRKRRTTTIMGQPVVLPASLPLQFELEAKRLQRSKRDKDVHKLVAILFGEDAFTKWARAGMDLEQFQVLLAWAPQVIAGADLTLAEVADALAEHDPEDGDKPDPT